MKKIGRKGKDFTKLFNTSVQAIKSDLFDLNAYKRSVGERLQKLESKGKIEYQPFSELLFDVFSSLYKHVPTLLPEIAMKKEYAFNRELIQRLTSHPKWKEMRVYTRGDHVISSVGSEFFGEELIKLIKELEKQRQAHDQYTEALHKYMEALEAWKKANGQGDDDGEGDGDGEGEEEDSEDGDGDEEGSGKSQDGENSSDKRSKKSKEELTLEQAKKRLEEKRKDFQETMQDKELRGKIFKMLKDGQDQITETKDLIEAWGLNNDPTYSQSDYKQKMELVNQLKNNPKLKQIAELAGKFKPIALSVQREKVKRGIDEIYSLAPGRDLGRILPGELMSLTEESLEMDFYNKMLEGKLLNYALRGRERKKRGPIIICLDSSGSMSGGAEIWSKAVGIALLEVARVQKRDFAAIHFDAEQDPQRLKTNVFMKNEAFRVDNLIDFCSYFSGGGTFFEAPLERAKMFAESGEDDWLRASIIFVTDGECVISDKYNEIFNAWKKQRKVKVVSILIDTYANSASSVKEFSDEVHRLSSLKSQSDELALDIFKSVL